MVFAKKSLGQNFLMHRQTAARIVSAGELAPGAAVVEVGPGTGMLTRELLAAGFTVHAIEADGELIPTLKTEFASDIAEERLILHHADIRTFPLETLPHSYAVIANIPYYITGEIIRLFLSSAHQPETMVLLVQKEVAERIARSKKGSLLSLAIQAYGTPNYCFSVPRGAFVPAPKVDSAVIRISAISKHRFPTPEKELHFFTVLRAGFAHKRKQLAKNLEAQWGRHRVLEVLTKLGLAPTVRAEDIPIETWVALANELTPQ